MKKLPKCNIWGSLEVSVKLTHLFIVQRMISVDSNNILYTVNDRNLVCVNTNRDNCSNTGVYSEESNKNCYHPLYSNIHCGFPDYNSISKTVLFKQYFHSGNINTRNSIFKRNFGEKIMSLRSWEKISENAGTKPGFFFTLMSYNVLAQDLLEQHPYLYKNHDHESLMWPYRWNNLLKEISRFQPDILCLQEVQESHLAEYYSTLESLGYQVVYKKRTGYQTDGCAIYYKINNITLVDFNIVEYYQPLVKLLNRDNVGIVMKFSPKLHPTREFVVANTHLLYNPRRDDVRMAQIQLLLTDIEQMSYKKDEKSTYYLPIIMTGDFNSPPYSDLYQFVTKGKISYEELSPKLLETQQNSNRKTLMTSSLGITDNCQHERVLEKRKREGFVTKTNEMKSMSCSANEDTSGKQIDNVCTNSGMLTHNFNFKSVYTHGGSEMNEGTTYQDRWLTVDYIFYSAKSSEKQQEEKLKLLARYRLPTSQELEGSRIPNRVLGSDHLSLIAKFKLEF